MEEDTFDEATYARESFWGVKMADKKYEKPKIVRQTKMTFPIDNGDEGQGLQAVFLMSFLSISSLTPLRYT